MIQKKRVQRWKRRKDKPKHVRELHQKMMADSAKMQALKTAKQDNNKMLKK